MEEHPPRRRFRVPPGVVIVGSLAVVVALAIFVLAAGDPPLEPTEAPAAWDALDFESDTPPKTIDLGEKRGGDVVVIVHSDEKVCWNGYIAEEPIEGCGRRVFEVDSAPPALSLNVRSESFERAFLGLAVWGGPENQQLTRLATKKKQATLGTSVVTT